MKFIEITTSTTTLGAEMVSAIYDMQGASGCVIEDKQDYLNDSSTQSDWDYIDETLICNMDSQVKVRAYFDADANNTADNIKEKIKALPEITDIDLGTLDIEINIVDDKNWENEWKKFYKTFSVGKSITVRPYWEDEIFDSKHHITLDPGMAFGNGTHETTFMCLELIEEHIKKDGFVYDIGCGTGILAIAAVMLGAKSALAIDKDSFAIKTAEHNIKLNNLQDKLAAKVGDLLFGEIKKADMIIANIIADVIIPFSNTAFDMLVKDGIFISSGIIKKRSYETLKAIENAGFRVLDIKHKGEWVSFAAVKI